LQPANGGIIAVAQQDEWLLRGKPTIPWGKWTRPCRPPRKCKIGASEYAPASCSSLAAVSTALG
jgi:hypothetical protein